MTAYEKAVIKAFLNEAFGQMSAEVDGQTIIPGYFDTDSSYPGNGASRTFSDIRYMFRDLAYVFNNGEELPKERTSEIEEKICAVAYCSLFRPKFAFVFELGNDIRVVVVPKFPKEIGSFKNVYFIGKDE